MASFALALFAGKAAAATLLSSVSLPSASATATGGGTFSASPSPRGASVPVPIGEVSMPSEAVPSAPASSETRASAETPKARAKARSEKPEAETRPHEREHAPEAHGKAPEEHAKPKAEEGTPKSETHEHKREREEAPEIKHEEKGGTKHEEETSAPQPPPAAIVTTAKSVWTVDLGFGWYNKYYFRGVDILKEISPNQEHGGIVTSKITMGWAGAKDAFSIAVGSVQALERQLPDGAARNINPNPGAKKTNENFVVPHLSRYQEYDIYAAYTRTLIPKKLEGTIGFNHYQFGDGNFYGKSGKSIPFADEGTVRLDYIGLPYIRPSLSFAKDFDAFEGEYLEARVDGGMDLIKRGNLSVRLEPYVAVSYDFNYNGEDAGWNAFEFGVGIPIRFNDHFSLTLTANYTKALEESNGQARTNNGFWGGAVFNVAWGGTGSPFATPAPKESDDKKMVIVPPPPKPWEFSAGAEWRQFDFKFSDPSPGRFDPRQIYNIKFRNGDLGLAAPGIGKTYSNGAIFQSSPVSPLTGATVAGVQNFAINNASQITGSQGGGTAHVTFTTKDFSYQNKGRSFSPLNTTDDDAVISPYIDMSREIWRSNTWSGRVGLFYSFGQAEGDSGVNLARLDTLFERTSTYNYVYSLDNVSTNIPVGGGFNSAKLTGGNYAGVVTNANLYAASYAGVLTPQSIAVLQANQPQTLFGGSVAEVARIATFVHTKMSVNSHDFAIPFSLRKDFGKRWHVEATVAPTLTMVNWDMQTDVDRRSLDDFSNPRNIKGRPGVVQPGGVTASVGAGFPPGPFGNPAFNASQGVTSVDRPAAPPVPPTLPAVAAPVTTTAVAFSGKAGSNPRGPKLPGSPVSSQRYDESSTSIQFGVDCKLALIWDIDETGTFFTEFWGAYHWADPFSMGDSFAHSALRPTAFQAGVGVGMRF